MLHAFTNSFYHLNWFLKIQEAAPPSVSNEYRRLVGNKQELEYRDLHVMLSSSIADSDGQQSSL